MKTVYFLLLCAVLLFSMTACQQPNANTSATTPTAESTEPVVTPPADDSLTASATPTAAPTSPVETAIPTPPEAPTPPTDWIESVVDVDPPPQTLVWQQEDLPYSGDEHGTLSLYVNADRDEIGEIAFDDGQEWLLRLETPQGSFDLFPRRYVQLGEVSCSVFQDMNNEPPIFHVLVTVSQSAGYASYDCVYDPAENAFARRPIYEVSNINSLAQSYVI